MIYLDSNSTTKPLPEVLEKMLQVSSTIWGNPHNTSNLGLKAKEIIEEASAKLKKVIGAAPESTVIWTSGATEANRIALSSFCSMYGDLVTTTIEHKSIMDRSFDLCVNYLHPHQNGHIEIEDIPDALRPYTKLLSIITVNNETGVPNILDKDSFQEIREAFPKLIIHSDAAQALEKALVNVTEEVPDLLSFSGHKIYGPKGIGALWVREGTPVPKEYLGTPNVPAIAGFSVALDYLNVWENSPRIIELESRFLDAIAPLLNSERADINGLVTFGGTISLTLRDVSGTDVVDLMERKGFIISTGSACNSGNEEPSHVLRAMGLTKEEALSTVRISIGRDIQPQEATDAGKAIVEVYKELRSSKK